MTSTTITSPRMHISNVALDANGGEHVLGDIEGFRVVLWATSAEGRFMFQFGRWDAGKGILRVIVVEPKANLISIEFHADQGPMGFLTSYYVYADLDTFLPVAKFESHGWIDNTLGCRGPMGGVKPPEFAIKSKNDPPFDFIGLIENWKRLAPTFERVCKILRGPDRAMVRAGMWF